MNLALHLLVLSTLTAHGATIAHYTFNTTETNRPLFRLLDSSGNGHHGRVIGPEPFEVTTAPPSNVHASTTALDARGGGDYAIIPHHPNFAPDGDWTIEFFIKPAAFHHERGGATNMAGTHTFLNTNLTYTILAKPNTNQTTKFGSAWAFHYQPASGFLFATISYGGDQGETLVAGKDLRDGEWHHIALTFRTSIENEVRLHVDGFLSGGVNQHGGNIPIAFGDGPIYVGAFSGETGQSTARDRNFDGFLDELRFSDEALDFNGFVGDFTWMVVEPEVHLAVEIRFPTTAGQIYNIEAQTSSNAWNPLGSVLGSGEPESFFIRATHGAPRQYRVTPDNQPASKPLPIELFDAVEIRFPTEDNQLYQVSFAAEVGLPLQELSFISGDGASKSFYERTASGENRFYQVNRY